MEFGRVERNFMEAARLIEVILNPVSSKLIVNDPPAACILRLGEQPKDGVLFPILPCFLRYDGRIRDCVILCCDGFIITLSNQVINTCAFLFCQQKLAQFILQLRQFRNMIHM